MRAALRMVCLVALALGALMPNARAADDERKLVAVFLGRFASYIEWPVNNRNTLRVTLIDSNPFGTLLDQLYQNKRIHDKPVEIRQVTRVQDIGSTDVLFITLDTQKARQEAIDYAQKNNILSISEAKGFAERGGIIQLSFVEQKPQIKINHTAAIQSGIKISAPLLSIATVITGEAP